MNRPDEGIRPKTPSPETVRKFLTNRRKRSTDSDYNESNFKKKYLNKEFVIKLLQLVSNTNNLQQFDYNAFFRP